MHPINRASHPGLSLLWLIYVWFPSAQDPYSPSFGTSVVRTQSRLHQPFLAMLHMEVLPFRVCQSHAALCSDPAMHATWGVQQPWHLLYLAPLGKPLAGKITRPQRLGLITHFAHGCAGLVRLRAAGQEQLPVLVCWGALHQQHVLHLGPRPGLRVCARSCPLLPAPARWPRTPYLLYCKRLCEQAVAVRVAYHFEEVIYDGCSPMMLLMQRALFDRRCLY